MPEGKQKLTLSVDSEVVQAAHDLGINISELTEQALRSFTYKPEDAEDTALAAQRQELFQSMVPLLQRYGVSVAVAKLRTRETQNFEAEWEDAGEVYLHGHGKLESTSFYNYADPEQNPVPATIEDIEQGMDDSEERYVSFYPTDTILKNFMKGVQDAKAERKQKVESLAVARRIVEAITSVDDSELQTTSKPTLKAGRK